MFSLKSKFRRFVPKEKSGKPYILPTLFGVGFVFLIVNIFALGYYRDNAPYHTVGLTLIVFGLVAMIHTNTNIQNVNAIVERWEASPAGEKAAIHVRLQTEGGASSHNIFIELEKHLPSSGAYLTEVMGQAQATLTVCCESRGLYPLNRLRLASGGVYGMFRSWRWVDSDQILVIYPKARGNLPLPTAKDGLAKTIDGDEAQRPGSGEDFQGHKPYIKGESLQHIDWKAYARGQDLLIKEYSSEGVEALDLSWTDTQGPTEMRLEQLSAWIAQLNRAQRSYSLHLPNLSLPRGNGSRHDAAAYYALAAFEEF